MRFSAALAATLAFGATAGHAQASELFDMFQQVCMAAHADNTQALAAADKSGWMPIPDNVMASLAKASPIENPQGRMRSTTANLQLMFVGHGKIPGMPDLQGDLCAVASVPPNAAVDQETADFAAVPRNDQLAPGKATYVWRDENSAHHNIDGDRAALKQEFERGGVNVVAEQSTEKMSIVLLIFTSRAL